MRIVALAVLFWTNITMAMASKEQVDSLYRIAYYASYLEYEDAERAFESICTSTDDYLKFADFYFLIGYKAKQNKDYTASIEHYGKSLKLASKYNDLNRQRKCAVNISKLYFNIADYYNSRVFTKEALKLADELGNDTLVARYHYDLGIIHRKMRVIDTAMLHLEKALYLFESQQSKYWQGLTLIELGICEFDIKRNQEAIDYYYQALNLNNDSKEIRSKVYNNHSLALIELGDTAKAMALVKKAIALKEEINSTDLLISSMNNLGIYYFKRGEYDSATIYLAKAFHENQLTEVGGSSTLDFLESYFYLDSIKYLTGNKHLLFDLGVYEKYDKFNLIHLKNSSSLEDEVTEMQAILINERLARADEQWQYHLLIIALSGIALVLLAITVHSQYKKIATKRKLAEGIRALERLK